MLFVFFSSFFSDMSPTFVVSEIMTETCWRRCLLTSQNFSLAATRGTASDTGIMLNEIYEYMEVTMSSDKTVGAKKKTLTYLLSGLKAKGIICTKGRKWKSVKR